MVFSQNLSFYVFWSVILGMSVSVYGAVEPRNFESANDDARYRVFLKELRCPKCQNQNLEDSNAPIAADLREQLYLLIDQGMTDDEIIEFMTDRYGDFVPL